jgi:hypothetical protein
MADRLIAPSGEGGGSPQTSGVTYMLEYIWNRIPNANEVTTSIAPVATISVFGAATVSKFGDNPTSKGIIRDATKIIGIVSNVIAGNELGGTGRIYDTSNVYASTFKVTCKGAIIYASVASSGPAGWLSGPPIANIICDPLTRVITLAGQDRQDEGRCDEFFPTYFINNLKTEWFTVAVASGAFKAIVVNNIGAFIASTGISKAFSYVSTDGLSLPWVGKVHGMKYISTKLSPTMEYTATTIEDKVSTAMSYIDGGYTKFTVARAWTAAFVHDFTASFVQGVIDTILLTPPARLVNDLTKDFIKKYFSSDSKEVVEYKKQEDDKPPLHNDTDDFDFSTATHPLSIVTEISSDSNEGQCNASPLEELTLAGEGLLEECMPIDVAADIVDQEILAVVGANSDTTEQVEVSA